MGTHAFINIDDWNIGVGMTMDGSPHNIEYVGNLISNEIEAMGVFDSESVYHVTQLLDAVVAKHPDWLFVDLRSNASWLSYEGFVELDAKTVRIEKC